jgi:hypothetical protein
MKGRAMKKIVKKYNLKGGKALEVFARDGSWQTTQYAKNYNVVECWEIDSKYETDLKKNVPNSCIKICDSIKQLDNCHSRYDLIVVDNPQNTYGKYCEHFEVIPKIAKFLKKGGYLIFNVNIKPFDYEKYPKWQKRRNKYYGLKKTDRFSIDELELFYWDLLYNYGYTFQAGEYFKRSDYLYYLVYQK